jgi:hypothetical protein
MTSEDYMIIVVFSLGCYGLGYFHGIAWCRKQLEGRLKQATERPNASPGRPNTEGKTVENAP